MRIFAKTEVQLRQAKLLAESGVVRAEFFLNGGDGRSFTWETQGYEERIGEFGVIRLAVERFGLFSRLSSTGIRHATGMTLHGLFGRTVPAVLSPSLTLSGHVGGLILHKGSVVEGEIVLHHGYVYARKRGSPLPDYTRRLILRESPPLPFDTLIIPELFGVCSRRRGSLLEKSGSHGTMVLRDDNDSLIGKGPLAVAGDCVIRSSECDYALIAVKGTCTVEQGSRVDNTTILAERIVCEPGCSSRGSLFFCEKNAVVSGGYHNSQFLSRDSVVVRKSAEFGKMTVLASLRSKDVKDSAATAGGGIHCGDGSALRGTLVSCASPGVNRNLMSPSVVLGNGTTLTGAIVTDGDCRLYECEIRGRLWARSIVAGGD